jgi:hypothetical protein
MNVDAFSSVLLQHGNQAKDIQASLEIEMLSDAGPSSFEDYLEKKNEEDKAPLGIANEYEYGNGAEQLSVETVDQLNVSCYSKNLDHHESGYFSVAINMAPDIANKAVKANIVQGQEVTTSREALVKKNVVQERILTNKFITKADIAPTFYKVVRDGNNKVSDVYVRAGKGVLASQLLEIKNQISKLVGAVRHFFYNGVQ